MNWGSRPLPGLGPGARIKMTKADGGHNCALARAARVRMSRLVPSAYQPQTPIWSYLLLVSSIYVFSDRLRLT
ncbi:hypothetical protein E4U22_001202 [Claviceps purpurea]|nr:hypothetical protein E4U49_005377 [Claviceps purpurea]KAG6321826.1 hypothetical protein E4U22_001202 [Claviceps purpurea]